MSIYYFLQRKCFGNALNMYHRPLFPSVQRTYVIANLSRHPYSLACNALMSLRSTALRCCGNLPEGTPHKTPAGYFCTRGKNRGPQKILSYFWGKGVCKHKTGDCRLRRLTGQKRSIRRVHKIRICRSIALFNDSALKSGAPKRYFVLLGKRSTQAKE